MTIPFSKYQGTGNDFILIDNRGLIFPKDDLNIIKRLCSRKFGIGSDGLILLENNPDYHFEMVFYNPDGSQSFCGNGSRCIVAFAAALGVVDATATFIAIDGTHEAKKINDEVSIHMGDVMDIEVGDNYFFTNTGSPHYVVFQDNIKDLDVVAEGRQIRNNNRFKEEGTNVNFVQREHEVLHIRTYERGVENETLSCGTGMTAVALCADRQSQEGTDYAIKTPGGSTQVSFERKGSGYTNIWLTGPAKFVYKGEIDV